MSAWRGTFTDLMRKRFSALVAYGMALVGDRDRARDLAQDAAVEVFSQRKTPRSVGAAERAVRDAMVRNAVAGGLDPDAAASVLIALDSFDEARVRKVLAKATPIPLPTPQPEWIGLERKRYVDNAKTYAALQGGMNAVMEPARLRHRGAVIRTTAIAAAVGVVTVSLGYGAAAVGLPMLARAPVAAAPSPSASVAPTYVTWDDASAIETAFAGFEFPECGDDWIPRPASVGGVTPKPTITDEDSSDVEQGPRIGITDGFVSDSETGTWLLAAPYYYVVTRDDEVVMTTADEQYGGLNLYLANSPPSRFRGDISLTRQSLCDAQAAAAELEGTLGDLDPETASQEEIDAYDAAWAQWTSQWNTFEPGTYRIYQVSPMVFGKQAALAQVFHAEGLSDLQMFSTAMQYTDLVEDPRVAPYCVIEGQGRDQEAICDVPPDVLKEVLTREIDPATVQDVEPGVGISEALEYVVD